MDLLADVDMHGIQTSGNCIRNITTDCFAGVAADEIVDPRPVLRDPAPVDHAPSRSSRSCRASSRSRSPARREDRAAIALARHRPAAAQERRRRGRLPGPRRRRHGPHADVGTIVREFLPWREILVYIEAIVRVYNRYGRRDNMYKARIKILVKAEGQRVHRRRRGRVRQHPGRRSAAPRTCIPHDELDRVPRSSRCRRRSRDDRGRRPTPTAASTPARVHALARAQRARAPRSPATRA